MAGIIKSLDLNFNSNQSICFNGSFLSNIEFILSKKDSNSGFTSCCLIGEHETNLYQNSQVQSLVE